MITTAKQAPKRFNDPRDSADIKFIEYEDQATMKKALVLRVELPHREECTMERYQVMVNLPMLNRVNVVGMLRKLADDVEKGIEWTNDTKS
jgi:hypothetical protein